MQLKLLSSTVFILNLDIMKDSRVGVFESFKQMKVKPFITVKFFWLGLESFQVEFDIVIACHYG